MNIGQYELGGQK